MLVALALGGLCATLYCTFVMSLLAPSKLMTHVDDVECGEKIYIKKKFQNMSKRKK